MVHPIFTVDQIQQMSYQRLKVEDEVIEGAYEHKLCQNLKKFIPHQVIDPNKLKRDDRIILEIIKIAKNTFSNLEEKGIKTFEAGHPENAVKQTAYAKRFKVYMEFGSWLQRDLQSFRTTSKQFNSEFSEFERNFIAFQYSFGSLNGGIDSLPNPHPDILTKLKQMALEWKQNDPLAIESELNQLEIQQLEEAAKYPIWFQLIENNQELREDFFKWAIRDYNPVEVFIKNPNTHKWLKHGYLSGILGRIRKPNQEEILQYKEITTKIEGIKKRVLTLPIYHGKYNEYDPNKQKYINILDPNSNVTFERGGYTLTLQEMWEELHTKRYKESRINFSAQGGLINFHPVDGVWNATNQAFEPLNINEGEWLDNIPAADIIDHATLEKQYGDKIKDLNRFFKVMATREAKNMNAFRAHGLWQIYTKLDNGKWKVVDIGLYPDDYPMTTWDGIKFFCNTNPRIFVMMDQNGSYSHRQTAAIPFFPDKEHMDEFLRQIHKIMITKKPFQFAGANCSMPVQKVTHKVFPETPNLFRFPISKARTGVAWLDAYLAFLDKCPEFIRNLGIRLMQYLLGSFRGLYFEVNGKKKWYSVKEFYVKHSDMYMFHPSYLHVQIERDKKNGEGYFTRGEFYWGNTSTKC